MATAIYGFDDRRSADGGRYPVTDESGAIVATIEKRLLRTGFEAWDAAGRELCAGGLRMVSWVATDPSGAEIARLRQKAFTRQRAEFPVRGIAASLRGQVFSRGWQLLDKGDTPLLESVPHGAGWFIAPDAWAVRSDGRLGLAEIVAVVELHRLAVKRERRRSDSF